MSRRMARASVGDWSAELAPAHVLDALFATISYRLEPNGWASRFPAVLEHLQAGRIDPDRADQALLELQCVARELATLPSDRVVWDLRDLRRRDDASEAVNRQAPSAHAYFVSADRLPLLDVLKGAMEQSRAAGKPLIVTSSHRQAMLGRGLVAVGLGTAWTILVHRYFPDLVFVPEGASSRMHHGPLVWPVGLLIAGGGALIAVAAHLPTWSVWARQHAAVLSVIGVALALAFVWIAWQ